MAKRTVIFDFDGVIHSYTSGWKGFDVIPDPVVPGIKEAIEEIRAAGYEVVVVSSRCSEQAGQFAIAEYLDHQGIEVDRITSEKPPALAYIDDRAITFTGETKGLLYQVENFQPWRLKDA